MNGKRIRSATWSDRFFNYPPAEKAFSETFLGDGTPDEMGSVMDKALAEVAAEFLVENPDCPFTAAELAADFMYRV